MPPVRRQRIAVQQRAENANQPSVNDLRQQCLDKGLSDHGRRNTLVARLQQHASTSSNCMTSAAKYFEIILLEKIFRGYKTTVSNTVLFSETQFIEI